MNTESWCYNHENFVYRLQQAYEVFSYKNVRAQITFKFYMYSVSDIHALPLLSSTPLCPRPHIYTLSVHFICELPFWFYVLAVFGVILSDSISHLLVLSSMASSNIVTSYFLLCSLSTFFPGHKINRTTGSVFTVIIVFSVFCLTDHRNSFRSR